MRATNVLRSGKLRGAANGRGWRTKLYAPTEKYKFHRVKFKDPRTGTWTDRPVPVGTDPDRYFDQIEAALDAKVALHSASAADRPTMRMLTARYVELLEGRSERSYVDKVKGLIDKYVLATHADLYVDGWVPDHSELWIGAARGARLSAARVEDLGVALCGLRKTARKKNSDGTRWLRLDEDPMEEVQYTRASTAAGEHRDYVPPSRRPTTDMVESLGSVIAAEPAWHWQYVQHTVGAYCGLRLGEQFGLRAFDVDLERRRLMVNVAITSPRNGRPRAIKRTKTYKRREVPYPASLQKHLIPLCAVTLGLLHDAPLAEVVAAQAAKRADKFDALDERLYADRTTRPIDSDECLLFIEENTGLPPTKERYGRIWRAQRAKSTWSTSIPWRNARHHTATWWRRMITDPLTGRECPWEDVAAWLGHTVATCLARYVRSGEDSFDRARVSLDNL